MARGGLIRGVACLLAGADIRAARAAFNFGERFEDLLLVGLLADVVHVDVTDDAVFVDDEHGAFRASGFFIEDAVALGDISVRPKIAQERVRDAAERFGPRAVGVFGVDRDAHNLSIEPFKAPEISLEAGHLTGSNRRKCEWIKDDDDVMLSALLGKAPARALMAFEFEIRRLRAHLQRRGSVGLGGPADVHCHAPELQCIPRVPPWSVRGPGAWNRSSAIASFLPCRSHTPGTKSVRCGPSFQNRPALWPLIQSAPLPSDRTSKNVSPGCSRLNVPR